MSAQEMTFAVGHEKTNRCRVAESPHKLLDSVWNQATAELSRVASAMGLSAERVQDVLQDVYLIGLQNCPRDSGHDELRRWLFRVTINRCNLEHRRGRRWRTVWQHLVMSQSTTIVSGVEAETCHDEERQMIARCLQALAPDLRSMLVLRYFSNLNSSEIGCILNLPDSTVRSCLRRARQQLAAALKRNGYDDKTDV